MELFFLFLILQFLSTSDGVSLDCPEPQLCSSNNLTATCQVSSNVIAWLRNGVHIKSYSINSAIGETYNNGLIQTTLVGRYPTISTLSISVVAGNSMEGLTIRCADGLSGSYKECSIQFINPPNPPANVTATNITESSIGLEWSPPASLSTAPITGYIVNVSYVNGTSFNCPVNQCNLTTGDTNKTLISGLKNDTQYLLSVSAINCIGEGSYSLVIQVTTGKSSIHISNLSFTAISYTTVELSWESSADTVQSFFVHLYTNTSINVASFIAYNQRLNVTNLTKGIDYYFVVQAKDSLGYISDPSPSLYFTLDDPDNVEVVNSSLTLLPMRSDHNNKSAVIKILIEYPFDESKPPIMSYLIRHNVTIHGNDTYVMYGSEHSRFSIDVPNRCVGSVFTVSIAAVNVLSTGKWTSVQFEIAQDSSSASGIFMTSVSSSELPLTHNAPLTTSIPMISSKTDSSFTSTANDIMLLPPSTTPKPVGQQSFAIVFCLLAIPSFLLFVLCLFILVCTCSILIAKKRKRCSHQKSSLNMNTNPCYDTVTINRQTSSDNNRSTSFMILPISNNPCYAEPLQFSFDEGFELSIATMDNSCYATIGGEH